MGGQRSITTEEAIKWALDPRNDNGSSNAIHVMAFSYDSDCPNDEDHVGAVIESITQGWFTGDGWTKEEADAKLYDRDADTDAILLGLQQVWPDAQLIENPCRCYDGISADDVDTFAEDIENGDTDGFGEWGPFLLMWEGDDPGEPRDFTPIEAVERLASFLQVFEQHSYTLDIAIDVLARFVRQVEENGSVDLEWGLPGDCWDRIQNDPDLIAEMKADDEAADLAGDDDEGLVNAAKRLGLGRHYGDPHCIWCLQAS